jgi:hypothetical protein
MKHILTIIISLVLVLCFVSISSAQVSRIYEKITPGNTITGFTTTNLAPTSGLLAGKKAIKANVYIKTNAINYDTTGTITITQSGGTDVGMYASSGTTLVITGYSDLSNFRCIDATSGTASDLRVTYFYDN